MNRNKIYDEENENYMEKLFNPDVEYMEEKLTIFSPMESITKERSTKKRRGRN